MTRKAMGLNFSKAKRACFPLELIQFNIYGPMCDAPNPVPGVKRGCRSFFFLVYYKLVHSYTVKHLT